MVKKKAAGKKPAVNNGVRGNIGLVGNNGVKSVMSEAARLDEVLMNEVVDPHAMRRTVEQGRRRRETSPSRIRERWSMFIGSFFFLILEKCVCLEPL